MGSSTENSAYQLTHNPWNLDCSPGGSSGGSSAAVAARFCPLAFGSDTGGSIRQPAALTGIVGFKPTYGRVSRFGLVAFASSLDQVGPFATSVKDAALAMEVIGKHCKYDSTSLQTPPQDYVKGLDTAIQGMKIGVPTSAIKNLDPEARENFYASLKTLESLGCSIIEINLDLTQHSIAMYYILATAEASTNLARFDGIRYGNRSSKATTVEEVFDLSRAEGFGAEVKRRILLGTYVASSGYQDAYYKKAQKVRYLLIQEFNKAFKFCSAIVSPTAPTTAFKLGAIQNPLQMYLQDIYTIPPNLAGLPAISIPAGFSKDGKPFGLHLTGPQMHDLQILSLAHHFEKATGFNRKIPPLFDDEANSD
jgi:aspartyl-tRNA(Asn)/glutamyl-tRNA(Gln) amidotransferase subunit A